MNILRTTLDGILMAVFLHGLVGMIVVLVGLIETGRDSESAKTFLIVK